ncbi:MAG TPA: DNA recombination protein RmuC [Caulobacteraceae bacterium]|jgi:DNA recombination protein RmuC|nr:DNA recombination protein RmuC [Caulobacteraceae bacterium]
MNTLIILALCGIAAGLAVWAMAQRGRAMRAETEAAMLREQAGAGAQVLAAQAALSAQAVAETLVARASESFAAQDKLAQAKLEAQLKPVADSLEKFQAQVTAAEKARAEESGGLKAQIRALMEASLATQSEARKLSAALRRGAGVQGRWGEQMLRNVLELAGMRAGTDFEEQVQTRSGAFRPDLVVRLPGGGVFIVDAKCSLNAFLDSQELLEEADREAALTRHAQSVRSHMQALAGKAYWDEFDSAPDFVVMFVPGEAFLAAAAERLPDLLVEGMEKRVILVTPSSLFALCKAVVYGWRVEHQAVNAKEIANLGRDLYKRLSTMGEHVAGVGRALDTAVSKYNAFVGSLESQVLTQARRFEELKADNAAAPIRELAGVEAATRPLTKLGAGGDAPALTLVEAAPTSRS